MKSREQLVQSALKTQDPATLYALFEQAIELVKFHEAKVDFARVREEKLKAQVERQLKMIDNLEKTLWKK